MSPASEVGAVAWSRSLAHAGAVGLVVGAAFGLVDGLIAARTGAAALPVPSLLPCLAAAVFEYALVGCVGLLAAAVVLRPFLARRTLGAQTLAYARLALFAGLFLELFWWSRPYLFAGASATSAPRLAATAGVALVALVLAFAGGKLLLGAFARHALLLLTLPAAVALAGGVWIAFAGGSVGSRGVKNARNERAPNVLLVVVDALRQDTLGCYGHPRVKTPHVDRLAAEGVLFENAYTQAPYTLTSFASFLTGKHARRHGLWKMVPGMRMHPSTTLPHHLKHGCTPAAAGKEAVCFQPDDWLNATFHTGAISTHSRLMRGFDLYFEEMVGHGIVIADSAWSVFRSDLLLHLVWDKARARFGRDVAGTARDWIEEMGERRFMAMVHLYSTHTPYDPEKRFRDLYADPAYDGPIRAFYAQHRSAIEDGTYTPTPADVEQIRNLYLGGVSQADARIGELVETLRARGILDDTLVIVLSDHGESLGETDVFGERMLWEHCHMSETNLRIPLVMRWPKGLPGGKRVAARVDEIDLLPTVSDLVGLALPTASDDYEKIDGTSLLPLVRGEVASVRAHGFAENAGWELCVNDGRWKLVVPAELLPPENWARGKTDDGWEPWLVDLANDPAETRNVLAAHPGEVQRLLALLRDFDQAMPKPLFDEVVSEEERRRLEGLGYVGDGRPARRKSPKKSE